MNRFRLSVAAVLCAAPLLAGADTPQPAAAASPAVDPVLEQVIAGGWRTPEAKARDKYRRPAEALTFWGLKPGMSILEIQPGGASWWTEILAPYAKRTGGKFSATGPDLGNPQLPEDAKKAREEFVKHYSNRDLYGDVTVVNWGSKSAPLPASTYDFILTARSVHGWTRRRAGSRGSTCRA